MTATNELRRMLDERGVEWMPVAWNPKRETFYHTSNGVGFCADQYADGVKIYTDATITPEQAIAATLGPVITGDTSDGYHTFNELYHHRAMLFSVIVRDHADLAWKSKAHHDGTMYDGMFIVGIETPQGQATYHYDIDPYWDMFECKELDRAPEWDGHTPDEAIARIATLGDTDATATRHGGADEHNSKLFEAARKWMAKAAHFEAENAKLRELVQDMLHDAMENVCSKSYWCDEKNWQTRNDKSCGSYLYVEMARELGVEVDE